MYIPNVSLRTSVRKEDILVYQSSIARSPLHPNPVQAVALNFEHHLLVPRDDVEYTSQFLVDDEMALVI